MKLCVKQLTREIFKNKIFIVLMILLSVFTSFLYFFVHFSIDGNMRWLDALPTLNENQLLYRNGLVSNTILALNMLAALTVLTGFVFTMFFSRFFKIGGKQLGCLKSLGFKDAMLRGFFVTFTATLSLMGGLIGLGGGYFASDVLIEASKQSYLVTGLMKGLNAQSFVVGLFVPTVVFCFLTFLTYYLIHGKETGLLLAGVSNKTNYTSQLRFANKISGLFPEKNRLSIRLALRKPIAALLIVISVMSFAVMFIMAYSLTLSSQKVFESQTVGHHYLFDTHFDTPQHLDISSNTSLPYLDTSGAVEGKNASIQRTVAGLEENRFVYELLDTDGNSVALPKQGEVVISSELQEIYGFQLGDQVTITVHKTQSNMTISGFAFNAKSNWVYVSKNELSEMLGVPMEFNTGILSMENEFKDGTVITNEQKLDALQRSSVSNRSSAIINQAIGCIVGCILLYLALLLNIQDSTRDILILHLMGYKTKIITKMLIDIYKPILLLSFVLTLWPAIQIVKRILKSLSMQIGDYMPFQTNVFVIAGIFVLLSVLYFLVLATFNRGITKIIHGENMADYANAN